MFGFDPDEYSFSEDVGEGSLSVALLEGNFGGLDLTLFVGTQDDNVNATAIGTYVTLLDSKNSAIFVILSLLLLSVLFFVIVGLYYRGGNFILFLFFLQPD